MRQKIYQTLLLLMLVIPLPAMADDLITVSGVVTDEQGEPLIGCTIQLKGSQVATVADLDGKFKMQVPAKGIITFSYIGYKTQELKAAPNMKVIMKEDSHVLNEVVAVGYGTMKRDRKSVV